ncbi:MAG: DUF1624 domain-containing protein [Candidatus Aenigmarchaeota archaeon]|nr:DUF1624 domain-containing protein [Candidatus Aenigmarchaeota archaeon]
MPKRFWKNVSSIKNNDYKPYSKRFWEIDAARGVAIILMILFHVAFDLRYAGLYELDAGWVFWYLLPRMIAAIFIILVGISATLSYNKSKKDAVNRFIRRGLGIFSFGMAITLATYLFFAEGTILFGILHFIGISYIMSVPFLTKVCSANRARETDVSREMRRKNILIGLSVLISGFYLQTMTFDFPWLLWLGFMPANFYTFDYFPIFPWFGFILLGIYLGNRFYTNGKRTFRINGRPDGLLTFLGRNSLAIYLVHQPMLALLIAVAR